MPVVADFSDPSWAKATGDVVDLIQIKTFVQTNFYFKAAAETKKPINQKRSIVSPWNMKNSIRKIEYYGNNKIMLADRGTFFGYNMLVNDMRCLSVGETGYSMFCSLNSNTTYLRMLQEDKKFIPALVRAASAYY